MTSLPSNRDSYEGRCNCPNSWKFGPLEQKRVWIAEIADELMISLAFIMTGNFVLNARNNLWKLPFKMYLGLNK